MYEDLLISHLKQSKSQFKQPIHGHIYVEVPPIYNYDNLLTINCLLK